MSERATDAAKVGAVLQVLLRGGKPVFAADPATGELALVSPQLAAAPHGFLPLFLAVGDTVWREATGRRLGIELRSHLRDAAQHLFGGEHGKLARQPHQDFDGVPMGVKRVDKRARVCHVSSMNRLGIRGGRAV